MKKLAALFIFLGIGLSLISASLIVDDSYNSITGQVINPISYGSTNTVDPVTLAAIRSGVSTNQIVTTFDGVDIQENTQARDDLLEKGYDLGLARALTTRTPGVSHPAGDVSGLAEAISESMSNCRATGMQQVTYNANVNRWEYGTCIGECPAGDRDTWLLSQRSPSQTCPTGLRFTSFFPRAATTALTDYGPLRIGTNMHFCCNSQVLHSATEPGAACASQADCGLSPQGAQLLCCTNAPTPFCGVICEA